MSDSDILDLQLRELKLPAIRANYRRMAQHENNPLSYLRDVVALEMTSRQENAAKSRLAKAKLPSIKTFETFDFSLQPKLPKMKVLELLDESFVAEGRNAIFYGPPGTGKTHCLIALGVAACIRGDRVLYTTAAGLLNYLLDAKREGILGKRLRQFERCDLLLIDELGYIPFAREATDLLFQVISQRYESRSIALTTNLAFEQWTQVFPDAMTASAVIDRLVHHGVVFEFSGSSHRLRHRAGNRAKPAKA
jgi:DNA replication protein DnaC